MGNDQTTPLTELPIHGSINYMSTVSDRLRQAITDSGLSQRQIARESDICRISLLRWLAGKQSLTTDAVDKLATYFGLVLVPESEVKQRPKGGK
jgi:transcriptional regulator with XRE-family HTH domain